MVTLRFLACGWGGMSYVKMSLPIHGEVIDSDMLRQILEINSETEDIATKLSHTFIGDSFSYL